MVISASFGTVTLQLHVSCSLYTVLIHDVLPKERTLQMLASRNIVFAWEALNSFVMEVYEASTHPCGVNLSATHPSIRPSFRPSIHSFIHPSIHPSSIYLSILPFPFNQSIHPCCIHLSGTLPPSTYAFTIFSPISRFHAWNPSVQPRTPTCLSWSRCVSFLLHITMSERFQLEYRLNNKFREKKEGREDKVQLIYNSYDLCLFFQGVAFWRV